MKKTLIIVAAAVATLSALVSCQRENPSESPADTEGKYVIKMSVQATKEMEEVDPDSKISYDWTSNALAFEDDDKLQIMIGKFTDDTKTAVTYSNQLLSMKQNNGTFATFEGTINLDPANTGSQVYSISDIKAATVVKSVNNNWRINCRNNNLIVYANRKTDLTQAEGGVFSSGNNFFYCDLIKDAVLDEETGELSASDLTLKPFFSALEFHVWSSNAVYAAEKVKSVRMDINAASARVSTDLYLLASTLAQNHINGRTNYGTVTLTTPAQVGSDKASTLPIWLQAHYAAMPVKKMTITTDRAQYIRTWSTAKSVGGAKQFYPLYSDIGSENYVRTPYVTYSVDGGTTWADFDAGLPSGTTYTTLAIKTTNSATIAAADLAAIKSFIDAQASPVALDMSASDYEATVFPDLFKGTSSAENMKLGSIDFPSNVVEIAASAFDYCSALKTVDLSGITRIGTSAFRYSGLVELNVPKTVIYLGNTVFAYCLDLKKVFYNSPHYNTSGDPVVSTFSINGNTNAKNAPTNTYEEFVFGPDAMVPRYCFNGNLRVTKITIQGGTNTRLGNNWGIRAVNLAEIVCFGATAPRGQNTSSISGVDSNGTGLNQFAYNVPTAQRIIRVPAGKKSVYEVVYPWKALVSDRTFTIVEDAE